MRRRVLNVENWLMSYVPDSAKFEVQETLPDVVKNLSDEQRAGLRGLASRIHAGVAAKDLHDLVYAVSEIRHLCEQDVSGSPYIHSREEIRSESGYFMASLDRKFLLDRLNEAGGASVVVDE